MLILSVLPLCFATAWSADILAVFTVPSVSHQIVYRTLTLELNRRGHRLTVITPNPINDDNLKNYREIDVSFQYELWNREMVARPRDLGLLRNFPEIFILLFSKISPEFCHTYLSSPQVQSFLGEKNEFDLMITEFGINPCVYGFAKYSGYKYIGIYSFQTNAVSHANFGNPNTASYIPDVYFPHTDSMTFLQRVRNVLFQIFFWATYAYTMWSQNFIAKQYFGDDIPHLIDLERNVSALFVNSHFSTSYPRPNVPNLIEFGGPAFHLNNRKLSSLPKDIQDFMDGAEHGVIYFSLGSNVKTIRGFEKEEKILIESFRRIKQRVLWKWENENIQIDLDNVRVSKWFPQVEILAHPNVKAFVTQGGLQSIGEAIEYRVPMIAIPFFADQGHNAMKMESVGIAITLDIGKLNTEEFTRALTDIVYDKKYKQKIIEYSKLVGDQPMHPLEKAIWWTEYVIRHDGAPHLRSIAATMPWYQYYMIDVFAAFSLIIFLFLYVVRLVLSKLFGMIFKKRNKSKKH